MLIRYRVLLLLATWVRSARANLRLHAHFRNYPTSSVTGSTQNGYDMQNPYAYPVRNTNVDLPPCINLTPIADNKTSVGVLPPQSLPPLPSSSVSYVPIQAPASVADVPTAQNQFMALPSVTGQQQSVGVHPQLNGHLTAQQTKLGVQPLAESSVITKAPAVAKSSLPYPTYETDMQVEMRRQLALAQQNIANWQAQQTQATANITLSSVPLTYQTLLPVQPTVVTTPSSLTKKTDSHSLAQLSPDELAAYATRLRQQMQQEKQQFLASSSKPAIRGQVNGLPLTQSSTVTPALGVGLIASSQISPQVLPAQMLPSVSENSVPLTHEETVNTSLLASNSSLQPLSVSPSSFPQQQVFSVQLPLQPAPKLTHEINYCDRRQFDDNQLEMLNLRHSDYFIYNTSCAGIFFQCAIGQTFVLKCPSVESQAFDPAISSCNFKNSVRFCPEYDHVLHCTIRETCTQNQFACCALPQQCIEYSRRCDGHRDCADGEDENNCPSCARDQFACVKSGTCISAKLRCDGKSDDCADGSNLDEIGCSKNETCLGKFVCDSPETLAQMKHSVCVDVEKYCDNQRDCPGGEDEQNCRQIDDSATKYLSCENQKQQVRREQWCDGREDCADGSDEKYCF